MVLIIDTDPGIDDMLALLLLLATPRHVAELRLVSVTYGNCPLRAALQNALSLFYVLDQENRYRQKRGLPKYTDQRPIVASGAHAPVGQEDAAEALHIHGKDGLGGSHSAHPEYTCPAEWVDAYFGGPEPANLSFEISKKPAWDEILDVLRSEPEKSVTIIAVGPLTNLAHAAEKDPKTFARVESVLSMGGAVREIGNASPVAEFNYFADAQAAARIFALSSTRPAEILDEDAPDALKSFSQPIDLAIFPLDITIKHKLQAEVVDSVLTAARKRHPDSPLLAWVNVWIQSAFKLLVVYTGRSETFIQLHDPLTAAYAIDPTLNWAFESLDIRVETQGRWGVGQSVADLRSLPRGDNPVDYQKWLTEGSGNRVNMAIKSPYKDFGEFLLQKLVNGA